MKIFLNGHDYRYAAEQIAMCVFPNDKPEFVAERPMNGDFAVISLNKTSETISSISELHIDEKILTQESVLPLAGAEEDSLELSRRARQVIKTSFYKAACGTLRKTPPWGALTGIRPAKVAARYLQKGLSESETDEILKYEFFVSENRRKLMLTIAKTGLEVKDSVSPRDASLYIGIPFCKTRCRYCSFVSHSIDRAGHLVEPYLDTLIYELSMLGKVVSELGISLKSVYIGGGTPTALTNAQLDRVMSAAGMFFNLKDILEYTVESGRPDTADIDKIRTIKKHGATRISVNPQTMDDTILAAMGRSHTAADIIRMTRDIRKVGGLDINMDLIAGLSGDTVGGFKRSLKQVLDLNPENVTVHTLALKKGSALKTENVSLPSGDDTAEMVEYSAETISKAGYAPYYLYRQKYMSGNLENVGYAKSGKIGLYNIFIMDELHTIFSAGAGGVTKLVSNENKKIERMFNPKYPYEYLNAQDKITGHCETTKAFYNELGDREERS